MRLALFGGTFDPPHLGHLHIAAAAADRFILDTIHFAPTGRQPLKLTPPIAAFTDRLAMTRLACKTDPRFTASDIDAPRTDAAPNYTVDALAALQTHGIALFNIVGADAFLTLRQWREPTRILELAEWIVISRPGFSLDDLAPLALTPQQQSRIHLLTHLQEDISATEIRERLRTGKDTADLLPPKVAEYIAAHLLYR